MQPDLLLFFSDQHTAGMSSYRGGLAQTPNMEAMCRNGVSFDSAYTPCPLCVPSRMAMLTGKLPSRTGVFTNLDTIAETEPTFLHSFGAAGYETVLFGRMHFIGGDQRHGFSRRFVGDTTPVTWARPTDTLAQTRGVYARCYQDPFCNQQVGAGNSPVLEYDRQVVASALGYLSRPHRRPQLLVVGTYGPHYPYVAPPELYDKYRALVTEPEGFTEMPEDLNPLLRRRREDVDTDGQRVLAAQAAYLAMIEQIDIQLGQIRQAFRRYREESGRPGVLAYLSDHGDQCGRRRLFGKNTFYEPSVQVPLILEGEGIAVGHRVGEPVSLLDMGATLCSVAGIQPPPGQAGTDLTPHLRGEAVAGDRAVIGELLHPDQDAAFAGEETTYTLARMVRKGPYKHIAYDGLEDWDQLFHLKEDPEERHNLACRRPDVVAELRQYLEGLPSAGSIIETQRERQQAARLLGRFQQVHPWQPYREELWTACPDEAKQPPHHQ